MALVQKWHKSMENLKVGDIVIMMDESVQRDEWKLARVVKVYDDGHYVRKVDVWRPGGR